MLSFLSLHISTFRFKPLGYVASHKNSYMYCTFSRLYFLLKRGKATASSLPALIFKPNAPLTLSYSNNYTGRLSVQKPQATDWYRYHVSTSTNTPSHHTTSESHICHRAILFPLSSFWQILPYSCSSNSSGFSPPINQDRIWACWLLIPHPATSRSGSTAARFCLIVQVQLNRGPVVP